jgi:hypothetical protein
MDASRFARSVSPLAIALTLVALLVWSCNSCSKTGGGLSKLRYAGRIVAVQTDSGLEYMFTTSDVARRDIVGAVYVRQPNRPQWDGAYLSVKLNGKTLSDEAEIRIWQDRMREHATVLRSQGDIEAAKELELYASLPTSPPE